MDKALVETFTASIKRTFKDMFGLEASLLGSRRLDGEEDHVWDLTGLIGLAGQSQGVVALRLERDLATRLLEGTGVVASHAEERRQLEGGLVCELSNIIAAAATASLDAEIAPPVMISGPNHKIGWPSIGPVLALSFGLPTGRFEVDLCVRS